MRRRFGSSRLGVGTITAKSALQALVLVMGFALAAMLKTLARVWNPKDIQDPAIQQKVLAHMQAAERGFRRLDAALERVGPEALTQSTPLSEAAVN